MVDTDMVAWIADSTASYQQDLYSLGTDSPTPQPFNAYTTSIQDYDSYVLFNSTRSMNA